jgi:putative transposase
MTNHVHILMTPTTEWGASRLMKSLGFRYVQHVNCTYGRPGTLFEGRFRSSLIEGDRYLLACQRYIEINPVRAELVVDLGEYPWSSYRANALGVVDGVVTPYPLYAGLTATEEARRAAYRGLFAEALVDEQLAEIRAATNGGFALGSEPLKIRGRLGKADKDGLTGYRSGKEVDEVQPARVEIGQVAGRERHAVCQGNGGDLGVRDAHRPPHGPAMCHEIGMAISRPQVEGQDALLETARHEGPKTRLQVAAAAPAIRIRSRPL